MSNVPVVYRILTTEGGLSPVQAAGMIGRWQQESGEKLNPSAVGDKSIPGASVGIGQWNRERQRNLKTFAGDQWQDPAMQARFALHELGIKGDPGKPGYGSEGSAGQALRNATNIEQASIAGMNYERPMGWTAQQPTAGHGYRNTVNNAQRVFELAGNMPEGATASAATPARHVGGAGSSEANFAAPVPAAPPPVVLNDTSGGAPPPRNELLDPQSFPDAPDAPMTMRDRLSKAIAGVGTGAKIGVQPVAAPPTGGAAAVLARGATQSPFDPQAAQQQKLASADIFRRLNQGTLY